MLTLNLWTYFIFIYYPKARHWCKKKHEHSEGLIFPPPSPNPTMLLEKINFLLQSPSVKSHIFQDSFSTVPRNNAAHIILLLPSFSYISHLLWLVLPSVKMSMFLQWVQYMRFLKSCPLGAQICEGLWHLCPKASVVMIIILHCLSLSQLLEPCHHHVSLLRGYMRRVGCFLSSLWSLPFFSSSPTSHTTNK